MSPEHPHHLTHRRRSIARGLVVAALFGMVVGPLLHSAHHRNDHVHGVLPFSAHALAEWNEPAHSHGGALHRHGAVPPSSPDTAPTHPEPSERTPFDHGDGSAAHLSFGLLELHVTLIAVEGVLLVEPRVHPVLPAPSIARFALSPRLTCGPPSAAQSV